MSNLVKPHLISAAVIATLMLIVFFWPSDDVTEGEFIDLHSKSQPNNSLAVEYDVQADTPESETPPSAVLPIPPVHVLQPDPGLSEDELYHQAVYARKCRDVPKNQRKLNAWLSQANANDELPERIVRILNAFESCQNIDAAYDYVTSFKVLAQQGNESALWQYWQLTEQEVFRLQGIPKTDRDAIIAARQEFKLTKYQLAEQLLLLGSERAMMRLMNAYRYLDPQTGRQNYVRSLALAKLVMKLSQNQDNYRRADWLKQHLEQRMSPQDMQQATELAEEIAKQLAAS